MPIKQLSKTDFLAQFDPSIYDAIIAAAVRTSASAVVCFENLQMDSSAFGDRTALCVGLQCTYQTVAECEGKWLNDLPSQRQYPVSWISGLDLHEKAVKRL